MTRRVAIVSDGEFYVGPHLARLLAARGHDIVIANAGDELVAELTGMGATVEVVPGAGNLADEATSQALVDAALARFGRIDSATAFTGRMRIQPSTPPASPSAPSDRQ